MKGERIKKRVSVISAVAIIIVSFFLGMSEAKALPQTELPSTHIIEDVSWHQQFNALSCVAGALEIVFDYFGPDIDQKEIMNVARTSSMGTWTPDVVRTGHFSYLSNAAGSFFPSVGPYGGFEERQLGYAAFSYTSYDFWLDELKALVADDIPVIVLMNYYPTGGGGHYRVVIGYDDNEQCIYFTDPWGRDLNHLIDWTGVIRWSYSDFQMGWNYSEYGAAKPYYGAVILPWHVSVDLKGSTTPGSTITVTANIEYPCPQPFDDSQFPAEDCQAKISFPEEMTLISNSAITSLGTISAGTNTKVSWKFACNSDAAGKSISVGAWGLVSGSVPEAQWQGQAVYYPAYSYVDAIGGEKKVNLELGSD